MRDMKFMAETIQECLTSANILLVGLAVGVFALTTLLECFYKSRSIGDVRNQLFVLYEFNIRNLFGTQPRMTHDTLYGGVSSCIREAAGTVLLLAAGRGARCTALGLAQATAVTVASAMSVPAAPILRGQDFSSPDDYWQFHNRLRKILARHRVAIVAGLELLHPQVATVFSYMALDPFASPLQGVVLLVLDTGERFSHLQLTEEGPARLAEIAVRECIGPFLDDAALTELVQAITWRTALVFNDPRHKPSLCPVCSSRR